MVSINEDKFFRIMNKAKGVPFKDFKVGDVFLYVGHIYANVPMELQKINNKGYNIEFGLETVDDDYYILEFIKIGANIVQETKTGCFFWINKTDEELDYHNPVDMITIAPEKALHIIENGIIDPEKIYSKLIYFLYAENRAAILDRDLSIFKKRAGEAYINHVLSMYKKIYKSEAEKNFYEKEGYTLSFYSDKPKIGEYFGFVGDINLLVPLENEITSEKWFCKNKAKNTYPLLFKKISEDEAVEVTSGIKFRISKYLTDCEPIEESVDLSLGIEPITYIEPTESFKKAYAKSIEDFEEFKNWLHEKEKEAKEASTEAIRKRESAQYLDIEDAYGLARVENAMFDLDKKVEDVEKKVLSKKVQ